MGEQGDGPVQNEDPDAHLTPEEKVRKDTRAEIAAITSATNEDGTPISRDEEFRRLTRLLAKVEAARDDREMDALPPDPLADARAGMIRDAWRARSPREGEKFSLVDRPTAIGRAKVHPPETKPGSDTGNGPSIPPTQ